MPHKQAILPLVQIRREQARLIGAANAVRFDHRESIAEMFDGLGLIQGASARNIAIPGSSVLLIGAGGAARAIAFSLARVGVRELTIANRAASTAEALADEVATEFSDVAVRTGPADVGFHDVIINATPLGMRPGDPSPVSIGSLSATCAVIDIVTAPTTKLLTAAAKRGRRTMNGGDMLRAIVGPVIDFWTEGL